MPLLEIHKVTKIYKVSKTTTPTPTLNEISVVFPNTGLVAITGESGCGKSSLLNILSLLDPDYEGDYFINGSNIKSWSKKRKRKFLCRNIGVIFQHYYLLEEHTVIYNIMIPALMLGDSNKEAKEKAIKLLESINFNKELYYKKVNTLSGGEKQRICVLRSLINDPNIILADEPTGALDSENSTIVMNILKEASKTKLVIMVSHNPDLVNEYSDIIIELRDGKVISNKTIIHLNEHNQIIENKRHESDKWIDKISSSNFKRRFSRNLVSILTTSISLIASLLVLFFVNKIPEISIAESRKHIDYEVGTITKETKTSISNGLVSLVNTYRPNEKEIKELSNKYKNYGFELNYDAIVPSFSEIYYNNSILKESYYKPVYSYKDGYTNKNLLIKGVFPTSDTLYDVIVNKSMFKLLNNELNSKVVIKYKYEHSITLDDGTVINDSFIYENSARVVGVVDEQEFLTTPTIYYSFLSLDNYISNYYLNNLSSHYGYNISWKDYILSALDSEAISSYSYRVFSKNTSPNSSIDALKKNLVDSFVIESTPLTIQDAFSKLIEGITYGLWAFVGIAFIGTVLIIGIISYSSYSEDRKRAASLKAMGASDSQIADIYIYENIILAFLSLALTGLLIYPVATIAFRLIKRFSGIDVIFVFNNEFIKYFLLMSLIIIFVSIVAIYLPIIFSKKISVTKELKDE